MLRIPNGIVSEEQLVDDLSIDNPKYASAKRFSRYPVSIPKRLYFFAKYPDGSYLVPRNYPIHRPMVQQVSLGVPITGEINFTAREGQTEIFKEIEEKLAENVTDFLLHVDTGKGKTMLALWMINRYKLRTLVVVPTRALGLQFVDRVKQFSNYSAGFFAPGKPLYDVTIVTYHLLGGAKERAAKDPDFYTKFGHVIFDEYHNAGATQFHKVNELAACKYRTMLTATFRRKDGMDKVLKYHFEHTITWKDSDRNFVDVYPVMITDIDLNKDFNGYGTRATALRMLRRNDIVKVNGMVGRIDGLRPYIFDSPSGTFELDLTDKVYLSNGFSHVMFETNLSNDEKLREKARKFIDGLPSKNILVLSSRLRQLEDLDSLLKKKSGVLKGKIKDKEYIKYLRDDADVVLGIDKLAKEGMDLPRMDTLVFLTSYRDIEQALGRVTREYKGKTRVSVYFFIYDSPYSKLFYGRNGAQKMFEKLGCTMMPMFEI